MKLPLLACTLLIALVHGRILYTNIGDQPQKQPPILKRPGNQSKAWNLANEHQREVTFRNSIANEFMRARNACLSSLIVVQHQGGFGNLFMEYASALGLAKRLNETLPHDQSHVVALPYREWEGLNHVFDGIREDTVSQVMDKRMVTLHTGEMSCLDIFPDHDSIIERPTSNWELAFEYPKLAAGNISLTLKMEEGFAPAIGSVASALRTNLRFKKLHNDHAVYLLRLMRAKVISKYARSNIREVVFVGIHVNRHDNRMVGVWKREPASMSYYIRALRWLVWAIRGQVNQPKERMELKSRLFYSNSKKLTPKEVTPPPLVQLRASPLIAVTIIGDDMEWVNTTLLPPVRQYISRNEVTGVYFFTVDSGQPMTELALLAQCNHTIISHGTYGATGAVLSGGRTVVYNMHNPQNLAESLVNYMPYWVLME